MNGTIRRCRECGGIITEDDDYRPGDDPECCELCNEETKR